MRPEAQEEKRTHQDFLLLLHAPRPWTETVSLGAGISKTQSKKRGTLTRSGSFRIGLRSHSGFSVCAPCGPHQPIRPWPGVAVTRALCAVGCQVSSWQVLGPKMDVCDRRLALHSALCFLVSALGLMLLTISYPTLNYPVTRWRDGMCVRGTKRAAFLGGFHGVKGCPCPEPPAPVTATLLGNKVSAEVTRDPGMRSPCI